jgi:hypothetical protein
VDLKLTIPGRCRRGLAVRGGRAVFLRHVRGIRLELVLHRDRVRIVERKGHLRHLRAEARVGDRWRRLRLDPTLRAAPARRDGRACERPGRTRPSRQRGGDALALTRSRPAASPPATTARS